MHRPILLPDAHTFGELLEYIGEWDHPTMSTRAGIVPDGAPRPRVIDRNEIGPFCTVDLSQLAGPRHRSMAVRATDAVLAAVAPRIVTPDDHLSFRIIGHRSTGRALVILEHNYIIGSHWLAEIDPTTLPVYPYAARDAAAAALTAEIRTATGWVPYRRDLPDGAQEYGYAATDRPGETFKHLPRPVMVARIDAAGNVARLGDLPA